MLGDDIEQVLALLGVTPARVERWVGRPCRCAGRKDRLNALQLWAQRTLRVGVAGAQTYLDDLLAYSTQEQDHANRYRR